MPKPVVAISRCHFRSSDAAVEAAVRETVALAGGVPERVRNARKVLIKPNFVGANGKPSDEAIKRHRGTRSGVSREGGWPPSPSGRGSPGRMVSCSEPAVARAVVALVREANPNAEIVFAESIDVSGDRTPEDVFRAMGAVSLVDDFGVRLVDSNDGEIVPVPVPGGGLIHKVVHLHRDLAEADAVVSIAKLKAHGTAVVTMSLKNMFGCLPRAYYGSTHRNFMHTNYFRLMRVIVDIATTLKPDLAVVDGMVASDHGMDHEPVETNLLLAGHDPVATDAVGAACMGFDPESEFPNEPFLVSENHLRLAAGVGLGTLCLAETVVRGLPLAEARSKHRFSIQTEMKVTTSQAVEARRAAVEQAAVYRARRAELLERYRGQYVFLRNGEVEWSEPTLAEAADRAIRKLPAGEYGLAIQVLPEEQEIERAAAYA